MRKKGSLIVLLGPSGCGKGTVLQEFFREETNTFLSVSVTTREPRPGEEHGVNYYFITQERYDEMLSRGEFLEHAEYVEHSYATPRNSVMEHIEKGENVILEIEMQGAMQVRELYPDAVLIFILPPSMEVLRQRLAGRGTEAPETVAKRIRKAKQELPFACECDYVVVNDRVCDAAEQLRTIIRAQENRCCSMRDFVQSVLSEAASVMAE